MSIMSSTPSRRRLRPNRRFAPALAAVLALAGPGAAHAQFVVFDAKNHLENVLQTARQLESLANEARSLAASPYSHLAQNSQILQDIGALARSVEGLGATAAELEQQFESLYAGDLGASDLKALIRQGERRSDNALRTARDLARHAVELERLGEGRSGRLGGALSASQSASGQTAAIQSSNQILAVLAEDLAAMRSIMLAQSRLLAEQAARQTADQAAGDAARRRAWAREAAVPPPPAFDPFPRARD